MLNIKFQENPFHVDGRTDTTKVVIAFISFARAHNENESASNLHGEWKACSLLYALCTVIHVSLKYHSLYILRPLFLRPTSPANRASYRVISYERLAVTSAVYVEDDLLQDSTFRSLLNASNIASRCTQGPSLDLFTSTSNDSNIAGTECSQDVPIFIMCVLYVYRITNVHC
jgi:hypothetical protein